MADSFDCGEQLHGLDWNSALPGSEMQLVTTVLQWLETHPFAGRDGSAPLAAAALALAFPCEQ